MAQVGNTGSTQNTPVDYSSHATGLSGAESLDRVGRGDLDGKNIKFSRQNGQSEVLQGQQLRAPVLDQPEDVKPTHLESANEGVGDINKLTEKAIASTSSLIKNARSGTLTQEQQAKIQELSDTLEGASSYLRSLHGQNADTAKARKSVLAGMGIGDQQNVLLSATGEARTALLEARHGGQATLQGKKDSLKAMGFSDSQIEALMALADPDDPSNPLASLHGGSPKGNKDALKARGYSEGQIEALLSLADPNDEGNSLASIHQFGSAAKSKLVALGLSSDEAQRLLILTAGFNSAQTDRILGLLNGQSVGSAAQKQLLLQLGFTEKEVGILLVVADPEMLKAQDSLIKTTTVELADQLDKIAEAANALSTGSPVADDIIEQLVDIFMVMELLHEMSVQSRRTARESRAIEYDAAKQEILKQAGEMRKAAVMTLIAGVVSGTMKVAAGATAMAGGAGGGANQSATQAQMSMQRSMQASQMISASGDLMGAGFQYQAAEHSARQKEHEAFQKTHDNAAQSESEWMQLQQDMVKTVQSKMDEIIRTHFETLKTLTRG